MNWGKRVKVPLEHTVFAASYRFGFSEGTVRQAKRAPKFFSDAGAYEAYCAGFAKAQEEPQSAEVK